MAQGGELRVGCNYFPSFAQSTIREAEQVGTVQRAHPAFGQQASRSIPRSSAKPRWPKTGLRAANAPTKRPSSWTLRFVTVGDLRVAPRRRRHHKAAKWLSLYHPTTTRTWKPSWAVVVASPEWPDATAASPTSHKDLPLGSNKI